MAAQPINFSKPDELESYVMTITPEMACDWLGNAGINRHMRQRKVDQYAETMLRGEWRLTGEAIKFTRSGQLIDGQHRLAAVAKSMVPIQSLVVRGIAADSFDVMDTGATRSASDMLMLHGYADATNVAATTKFILFFQRYGDISLSGRIGPTRGEILAFVEDNYAAMAESLRLSKTKPLRFMGVPPAMVAGLHYIFSGIDSEDASDFFAKLGSGLGIHETHPVYQLRKQLFANAQAPRRYAANHVAALFIKAWNLYREGGTIRQLIWRSGGATPEQFPEVR